LRPGWVGFINPHVTRQGTPCESGYFLPEEAHQQLQSLRHYLHLLTELSQPERTNPDHLILPRGFTHLAEAVDQTVATTSGCKPTSRSSCMLGRLRPLIREPTLRP
jgi:hypothetical protein